MITFSNYRNPQNYTSQENNNYPCLVNIAINKAI